MIEEKTRERKAWARERRPDPVSHPISSQAEAKRSEAWPMAKAMAPTETRSLARKKDQASV